ncbi:MAG: hypothetical protein JST39_20260 [Bacteroidetes bacterium]|nr:hypothetical protein [Bacteroidota bacterium]
MAHDTLTEQHPSFPSGDWEGFYTYNYERERGEMAVTLHFSGGHITGAGCDPVGLFVFEGSYDTKAETCSMVKKYVGKHTVSYTGVADENGIYGKWAISNRWHGGFHIWPKKGGHENEAREEKSEQKITEIKLYR